MATSEEKRWAKEARLRRQALKKAAMPPTNLFQARIRRTELNNRPRSHAWLWILFLMIGGAAGAAWWAQRLPGPHDKLPGAAIVPPTPDVSAALQASSAPVVAPVAVSVAPVVNSAAASSTETTHAVIPDTREWHSPASGIHDVRQVVIKSGKRWRALWTEMGRLDETPRVDFYDHWVVGVFLGPKDGAGFEVQLDPPQETDDQLTVPYRVLSPLPGVPLSTEKTYPWQLRIIPRTDKPLHFELVSPASSETSH
jgi:hypothetical protein